MNLYAWLKEHRWLLWLLYIAICMIFPYLLISLPSEWPGGWEILPPLPNGETARDFTDVLPKNRINVVTDQGNYYSCWYETLDEGPGYCWISIAREVNTPPSSIPGAVRSPLPPDTQKIAMGRQHFRHYDSVLTAIIRKNGQVAFQSHETMNFIDPSGPICLGFLGTILMVAGLALAGIIRGLVYLWKRITILINNPPRWLIGS